MKIHKKLLSGALLLMILAGGTAPVAAEETRNNGDNLLRGVANVGSCFLEIPRCMLLQNSRTPFWGLIYGALEGGCLTALRAFGGVTDLIFLGYDSGLIYQEPLTDYVWDAEWIASPTSAEE